MRVKINKLAKSTRFYRELHKTTAIILVAFIILMSITGILLAWKNELFLKPSTTKTEYRNSKLIPIEAIQQNAIAYIDSLQLSNTINRIDYRPSKGIAKIRFEEHFTELQIDCYSGKITSVKQRNDTIIEMIHDGSILDFYIKNDGSFFKLFYASLIGIGLIFICSSGIILWMNPKKIKKIKSSNNR